MRNFLFTLLLLAGFSSRAQHTISGTFFPSKDYGWLIAYQLKPGTHVYIADTAITDGKFILKIPENAALVKYRLVYSLPQEEFYFDVVYSGKENIELVFKASTGVDFKGSKENILFSTYFAEIDVLQRQPINFYASGKSDEAAFLTVTENLKNVQRSYEKKSEGLLAEHFIRANHPYIPPTFEKAEQYIRSKKKNYFDQLDFTDPVLQGSAFLTNKLVNYVFMAFPPKDLSDSETTKVIRENIKTAETEIQGVSKAYRFDLFYSLWEYASALRLNDISDLIFENYLDQKSSSKRLF